MKASAAKQPKFDAEWWSKKKAKGVDSDNKFKKALENYTKLKKTFEYMNNIDQLCDQLQTISKLALATTKQTGIGQGDTKLALQNYSKIAKDAKQKLSKLEKSPELSHSLSKLVKANNPNFKEYFKKQGDFCQYEFYEMVDIKKTKPPAKWVKKHLAKLNVHATQLQATESLLQRIEEKDTTVNWEKEMPWNMMCESIYQNISGRLIEFRRNHSYGVGKMLIP